MIGRKPKQKFATIWQPGQSFILVEVGAELVQQENAHVNVVGVTLKKTIVDITARELMLYSLYGLFIKFLVESI